MKTSLRYSVRRLLAIVLSFALLAMSASLPVREVYAADTSTSGSSTVTSSTYTPVAGQTYTYNFASASSEFATYTSTNKITTAWSSDGLLKLNGGGTMYYHGTAHGLAVYNTNSFEVKVAGNAVITFTKCAYSSSGSTITASGGASGGQFSTSSISLQGATDGAQSSITYSGGAGTLTFTVTSSGTSYLHGITVQNTTSAVTITPWAQKNFSVQIGDSKLDITGAAAETAKATASISSGTVYYATASSAYASINLAGKGLSTSILQNLSTSVVSGLSVDASTNEVVATFADQTSNPKEYRIKVQDQSAYVTPGTTDVYTFDLAGGAVPKSILSGLLLSSYTTDNGILSVAKGSGTASPYWHDSSHGLAVYNGNYIDVKVAGNARIVFTTCVYGASGTLDVTNLAAGGRGTFDANSLKAATDGTNITYSYKGGATTLRFTAASTGESYLHAIKVENTTEDLQINNWAQKNFSVQIGGSKLDITGAASKSGNATAALSSGTVYYATSTNAYVSVNLAGKNLSTSILQNLSSTVISSLTVDATTNEIVASFADQSTDPAEYRIKVQDQSVYVTPGVIDVFTFDLAGGAVPTTLTSGKLLSTYTTDNGILTIANGSSTKPPYWHDNAHGLAVTGGNYMDIKVAGDASIVFTVCQYGTGGTLDVTNLATGGTGSFDTNALKAATDGTDYTYTYKGGAATLRFTVVSTGESYLHKIAVKNTGTLDSSAVAHIQPMMPAEIDHHDSLTITANGHRLYASHSDATASISTMTNVGYYVFGGRTDLASMEADVKIRSVGTSSSSGVFFGMMEDSDPITKIATLGVRGDSKVRNVYNKDTSPSAPSAGSTDVTYKVGDTVHLISKKTATGWHTEATIDSITTAVDIDYSKIAMMSGGAATSVKYGFAFANVDAMITNLTFKDASGSVLYDQNAAYDAVGTAPVVTGVEQPVLSSDRTKITVAWSGDTPADDGVYVVELSTDGGSTYTTLNSNVTEKSYTADVQTSGTYLFRIHGVCGSLTSQAQTSASLAVIKPLTKPVVTLASGDSVLTASWGSVDQATSYEIYRKSSEETSYTKASEVSGLTFTDYNVQNEVPYYYYVVAKSATNSSNPSDPVLSVPSAGHIGQYVYEDEAAEIVITKKSYDTVFTNKATIQGVADRAGTMKLSVNDTEQGSVTLQAQGAFSFQPQLAEGRNDVNLIFTDGNGKITRKTFNFVYLTNYSKVVDHSYTGTDGAASPDNPAIKLYSTVQAAVNSVPSGNQQRVTILIKEGSYVEHLRVASPYISLIGEDRDKVNINFYDPVLSPEGGSTTDRNAVYIQSGATGFTAENLTFENTYQYLGDGTKSNESADALRVDADQSLFVNVKLLGYQDTLYASSNHQYYYKSYILGNVDFIYGGAQALFNDSDIVFRYNANKNSGYVTAPNTASTQSYGYIFTNSRITAQEGASGTKYLLARPWGPSGAATFISTYMSGIINKNAPYSDMSGNLAANARFYEYYTYGDGFAINSSRPQISRNQAEAMLTTSSLGWDPYTAVVDTAAHAYVGNIVTQAAEKFIETAYTVETADPSSTKDRSLQKYALEGYASVQGVTGGGLLLESSSHYYKASTAAEFLKALSEVKSSGKASVIELTGDIALGSKEIGTAMTTYSSVIQPASNQPLLHPTLIATGVSTLELSGMSNLTIFSKNGAKITHTTIDISGSSNIILRNLAFDELWEWDEATGGNYDRNDWDYITIEEGSTGIWIDHATFYKSYDGIVDVKKAVSSKTSDVTISWSKFMPGSQGTFFDDMMSVLEANPQNYPYYNELLTTHGMTKAQVRQYASAQKKSHLIGASDTEANMSNLRLTLANNYYKNSMDRMPRLRAGYGHVYNTVMDASDLYTLKKSLTDDAAASKIVSNGAISTVGASVLVENSSISGITNALLSGNGSSPAGYIAAVNSVYYMDGAETELKVTDTTNAGLVLNVDAFKAALPYGYNVYDAKTLSSTVVPYAGAGAITMSTVQWEKSVYNNLADEDTQAPVWVNGSLTASNVSSTGLTLTWSGAADNTGVTGYKIYTVTGGVYNEIVAAANGTTYNVTGLNAGTAYTFAVKALDAAGNQSADAVVVTVITANAGTDSGQGSSGSTGSGSTGTTGSDPSSGGSTDSGSSDTPVGTGSGSTETGVSVKTPVQDDVVTKEIAPSDVSDMKTNGNVYSYAVKAEGQQVKVNIAPEVLHSLTAQSSQAVLQIETRNGTYSLPANLIDVPAVARQMGVSEKDVKITVTVEKVQGKSYEEVQKAASSLGAKLLAEPVEFSVSVQATNGKSQEIKDFSSFVERSFTISQAVDPQTATGVLYDPDTRTLTPVPTVFNGTQVKMLRQGNSIYTVINRPRTFADLTGHWAKTDVETLASKFIVNGINEAQFAPDQNITRAQFAALLVRALGLKEQQTADFSDVAASDWYSGAVGAAVKAKLVNGFEDGSFRPNASITREQMVTMIARALKLGGAKLQADPQALGKFADRSAISAWSEEAAAQAVSAGIIQGTTESTFAPQDYTTRAQAASMLKRTLQALQFMN